MNTLLKSTRNITRVINYKKLMKFPSVIPVVKPFSLKVRPFYQISHWNFSEKPPKGFENFGRRRKTGERTERKENVEEKKAEEKQDEKPAKTEEPVGKSEEKSSEQKKGEETKNDDNNEKNAKNESDNEDNNDNKKGDNNKGDENKDMLINIGLGCGIFFLFVNYMHSDKYREITMIVHKF